jgi:hypothetical protein
MTSVNGETTVYRYDMAQQSATDRQTDRHKGIYACDHHERTESYKSEQKF